jgi:hypothetical protein
MLNKFPHFFFKFYIKKYLELIFVYKKIQKNIILVKINTKKTEKQNKNISHG